MKLALVIPWFGRELKGGAEQQAWEMAVRFAARGHEVEVLTTCCRSHQDDWETNHWSEGASPEPEGFTIRRFAVDARDRVAFHRVSNHLQSLKPDLLKRGVSPVSAQDSATFVRELIKSRGLIEFVEARADAYAAFILLPYLYGPIIEAIRILGRRAALQPCLHDEAYAYLPEVAACFNSAGFLFFNSAGEMELAARLFGPGILGKSHLIGEGVETTVAAAHSDSIESNEAEGPRARKYLLYLGRKDRGKSVDLLLRAFARFRGVRPNSELQLVLAGHGTLNGLSAKGAIDLGLVSEARKQNLLRDCLALAQPSTNESFSRVMMEAWLHARPVAVHSDCLATAVAVREAKGGWTARNEEEWARLFLELERMSPADLDSLGQSGRRYAQEVAEWDGVMERYEKALQPGPERSIARRQLSGEINQFLPNLTYGDAVSNHALLLRNHFRSLGIECTIFAKTIDPRVAHECEPFTFDALHSASALIYHHSVGTDMTRAIARHRGPKCLLYHNITPAPFFDPYRPEFAAVLRAGRDELRRFAPDFSLAFGVSAYNADELKACGFADPGVLPFCVDPVEWPLAPDATLMSRLQDGRTNLLFVGRISPNKKQDDLVRAFHNYLAFDPTARLNLVGAAEPDDPYAAELRQTIKALGLQHLVVMTGSVSASELAAYYRTAHLFWSMSEHEGFGVPLVEAMWYGVPVFAFCSAAVPETLGGAAFLFTDKRDMTELSGLAHLLVSDEILRGAVLRAQRRQRERFLLREIEPKLDELAMALLSAAGDSSAVSR